MHCGVLGDPVAHSLSPPLHRAGYAALGLDWTYDAHRVPAGGLVNFLARLDRTWRGLSLTMPLKREALGVVDQVTDRARRAGAVNTVVLGEELMGDNTDLPGAVAAIRERTDQIPDRAVILGGGATATSTGLAILELGARSITLAVRDEQRAGETLQVLRSHPSAPVVDVATLADDGPGFVADIVVSTVPAPAQTSALVARCADVPVLFEVLYDPWPTPLAASAADRVLIGGLDLLVHQAALQFELFTGRTAPLSALRAAGESALAERGPR